MVPLGPHAFMPGYLYHTNEILVLLGDNWFVQRSAKQACDIVSRRQKTVEKKLSDARKELEDAEARLHFTSSLQQDGVEIREEVTDDDHQPMTGGKRIAHKKKSANVVKEVAKKDDDLSKRLEELEHQEEENKEMDNAEITPQDNSTVINVKHSTQQSSSSVAQSQPGVITTPADICGKRHSPSSDQPEEVVTTTTKSVHWSQDITSSSTASSLPQGDTVSTPLTPMVKPFTGSVVETSNTTTQTGSEQQRKVSRFKASRKV
ncbi:unconventional prefoldin RPB5 interactor-like isoform X2 [Dysidea avara]